jgi:hypothetical protein
LAAEAALSPRKPVERENEPLKEEWLKFDDDKVSRVRRLSCLHR